MPMHSLDPTLLLLQLTLALTLALTLDPALLLLQVCVSFITEQHTMRMSQNIEVLTCLRHDQHTQVSHMPFIIMRNHAGLIIRH